MVIHGLRTCDVNKLINRGGIDRGELTRGEFDLGEFAGVAILQGGVPRVPYKTHWKDNLFYYA